MTSVVRQPCLESTETPPCGADDARGTHDVESAALLALSCLDHRMATRDRYEGAERTAYVAEAVREARMALDGATIETILESRSA